MQTIIVVNISDRGIANRCSPRNQVLPGSEACRLKSEFHHSVPLNAGRQ